MITSNQALKQLNELKRYGSNLRLAAESWDEPWKSLVSTMLSARTRDEVTIKVCDILFEKFPTIDGLSKAKLEEIEKIIRPVNYYRTKSKNIIECAKAIVKEHNSKPPLDFEKLLELSGVGRKTANVFLSEMGKDTIGVDTHVFQLTRKLGWTKQKKPEKIEADIKKLFPRNLWKDVNPILVRFGRTYRGKKQDGILKIVNSIK